MKRKGSTFRTAMVMASALAVVAACGASSEQAADYPDRRITVTMPTGPGGTIDSSTRILLESWDFGVRMVPVNQEGGATEVGALSVLQGDHEGYDIMSSTADLHTVMAALLSDRVNVEDFAPIGSTLSLVPALYVHKDAPWDTAEEFIAALQEPNSDVTIAVTQGTGQHLLVLHILDVLGSDAKVLPGGGADSRNAVAGGVTNSAIFPAASYTSLADQVRILAVFGDENTAPDITDNAPAWNSVSDVEVPAFSQVLAWYVSSKFRNDHPDRYQTLVESFKSAVESDAFRSDLEAIDLGAWIDYKSPSEIEELDGEMLEFIDQYGSLLSQ